MNKVIKGFAAASAIMASSLCAPALAFPWPTPQVNGQGTTSWQSSSERQSMGFTQTQWTRKNCDGSCLNEQGQAQDQYTEKTTGSGQGSANFTITGPFSLGSFGGFGGFSGSFFR